MVPPHPALPREQGKSHIGRWALLPPQSKSAVADFDPFYRVAETLYAVSVGGGSSGGRAVGHSLAPPLDPTADPSPQGGGGRNRAASYAITLHRERGEVRWRY